MVQLELRVGLEDISITYIEPVSVIIYIRP